jgi:UDP-N-acetylmuramate dehydrogenase
MRENEPMRKHTTVGVGGPGRWMVLPASASEVQRTVRLANKLGVRVVVVGKGSNLIVRDGGYNGIVIKLAEHMTGTRVNQRTVNAEGGASFAVLARSLAEKAKAWEDLCFARDAMTRLKAGQD